MNHFDNPNLYGILYNSIYGGFTVSREGREMIIKEFPDKKDLVGAKWGFIHESARSDQELVRFMAEKGLEKFQGKHCKFAIIFIPVYENIKIRFKIEEYDGRENISVDIDFREIAKDLSKNTNNNPLTPYIRERGFENVIDLADGDTYEYD
jgi:hypothetical protein